MNDRTVEHRLISRTRMTALCIPITLTLWGNALAVPPDAKAIRLLDAGKALLLRGYFDQAKKRLSAAQRKTQTTTLLAKIAFYRGLCDYANGDTVAAENAFRLALSYNPNLRIDPAEVNPTVRSRFEAIRATLKGTVVIELAAGSPKAAISLDGQPITVPFRSNMSIGEHVIEGRSRSGQLLLRRTVVVKQNRMRHVQLDVAAPKRVFPTSNSPATRLRSHSLSVGIGGLAGVGSAPAVSGGATMQIRARYRWASAGLEGRFDAPTTGGIPGGEIQTQLLLANALMCGHWHMVEGCGVVGIGAVRARSDALVATTPTSSTYVSLGARAGITLPLFWVLSIQPYAELTGQLRRTKLETTSPALTLWHAPPVSAAFGLAVLGAIY